MALINQTMPDYGFLLVSNSDLDRIIEDGKVNTSTAMIVFAVELKSLGEKTDALKKTFDADSQRYIDIKDFNALDKRVSRIENAIIKVLAFIFFAFLGASVLVKKL